MVITVKSYTLARVGLGLGGGEGRTSEGAEEKNKVSI